MNENKSTIGVIRTVPGRRPEQLVGGLIFGIFAGICCILFDASPAAMLFATMLLAAILVGIGAGLILGAMGEGAIGGLAIGGGSAGGLVIMASFAPLVRIAAKVSSIALLAIVLVYALVFFSILLTARKLWDKKRRAAEKPAL